MRAMECGHHVRVLDGAGDMVGLIRFVSVRGDRDPAEVRAWLIRTINESGSEPPLGKRVAEVGA